MKAKERRMKEIGNLLSSLETYESLKPVHDEYMKIGWKRKKEKFAEAHSAELENITVRSVISSLAAQTESITRKLSAPSMKHWNRNVLLCRRSLLLFSQSLSS